MSQQGLQRPSDRGGGLGAGPAARVRWTRLRRWTIGSEVTRLLGAWRASGDEEALNRLVPLVYDELHALAARRLRTERPDHTLQATALVHEAYARLIESDVDIQDRSHFLALAATAMRRILVDYARARGRSKRGGHFARVTLGDDITPGATRPDDFLALDDAIRRLAERDERKAKVLDLHFFGGLTYAEIAATLAVSEATVDRDLRMAKAWIATR